MLTKFWNWIFALFIDFLDIFVINCRMFLVIFNLINGCYTQHLLNNLSQTVDKMKNTNKRSFLNKYVRREALIPEAKKNNKRGK